MDPFEELAFQDFYRVGMDERAIEATRFDQEIWNRWKIIKRFTGSTTAWFLSFFLFLSTLSFLRDVSTMQIYPRLIF